MIIGKGKLCSLIFLTFVFMVTIPVTRVGAYDQMIAAIYCPTDAAWEGTLSNTGSYSAIDRIGPHSITNHRSDRMYWNVRLTVWKISPGNWTLHCAIETVDGMVLDENSTTAEGGWISVYWQEFIPPPILGFLPTIILICIAISLTCGLILRQRHRQPN